jgi:hypothetical protein
MDRQHPSLTAHSAEGILAGSAEAHGMTLTRSSSVKIALAALALTLTVAGGGVSGAGSTAPRFVTKGLGLTPAYGEPSLAIARNGRNVVISTPGSDDACKTTANSTVQFWWSSDDGATFHHSCNAANQGGGDSAIDFLPNGTLLSADLRLFDSFIQKSTDGGKTWTKIGPAGTEQDRQWFAHSPDGKTEYLVYHDFAAEAEFFAKSTDGGNTWSLAQCCNSAQSTDQIAPPGIAVAPKSGDPVSILDQGGNTFSGPMLVDPKNPKNLYVVYSISNFESNLDPRLGVPPYGPPRGLVVLHSGDGGASWESHYAVVSQPNPDPSTEDKTGVLFPWGTIDRAGNVYIVYDAARASEGDHYRQYYVWSSDHGKTWSKPIRLDHISAGKGAAVYATGDALAPGVLDVAWYQSDNGTPAQDSSTWHVEFTQVRAATSGHPLITSAISVDGLNHHGGICLQGILCGVAPGSGDRSLLDFFQLKINPRTGMAEIAYAFNFGGKGQVMYAKQTAGLGAL